MNLREELELLRDLGYTHLDYEVPAGATVERVSSTASRSAATATSGEQRASGEPRASSEPRTADSEQREAELLDLGRIAAVCQKCRLAKTRTNVVYGVGDPDADLMFIGEAP